MAGFEDVEQLFVAAAQQDLERCDEVTPAFAAFCGDRERFLAWLRPFPKGGHGDPVIEVVSLAAALDADRLVLAMSGRAWSLDDPIPPVTDDVDLRQRVLVLHLVDGAQGRPRSWSVLRPYDLADGRVSWGARRRLDEGAGWVAQVLETAVRDRHRLRAPEHLIRQQVERLVDLGHDVYLAPDLVERLLLPVRAG